MESPDSTVERRNQQLAYMSPTISGRTERMAPTSRTNEFPYSDQHILKNPKQGGKCSHGLTIERLHTKPQETESLLIAVQNTAVTLCGWSAKQTIPLSVLARNQTKAWARDLRRDRKWVRKRDLGVEKGTLRKWVGDGWQRMAVGSRHRTAEETNRHEIGSKISEGRAVKMSQHSSWLVEISLEIHAIVSLQMDKGMHSVTESPFLHLS